MQPDTASTAMRTLSYLLFPLAAATSLACTVGETYDQVIKEKGRPANHLQAGDVQVLSYPDAVIKLNSNVVVSVRRPDAVWTSGSLPPAPRQTAALTGSPALQAPAPEAHSGPVTWTTDYNAALDQAKSDHKHVFLFFTGSDWCGWCKKLNREILTTSDFNQYAQDKLELVELDYPRQKPQSDALRSQNRMLMNRYNVTGFPTVVVLDSTGKAVARLGYQEGGPGPFISSLQQLGN
jgi:thiol-disulfide isomerase/thioredoxin